MSEENETPPNPWSGILVQFLEAAEDVVRLLADRRDVAPVVRFAHDEPSFPNENRHPESDHR